MINFEQRDEIKSREDFVNFLLCLARNFRENKEVWHNHTVDEYLEAVAYWVEDMDGFYRNNDLPIPEAPNSWIHVADMLRAGRVYS